MHDQGVPAPRVFFDGMFVTVMEFIPGKVASDVFRGAGPVVKRRLLRSAGSLLRRIHGLRIPSFWVNERHPVSNKQEWKQWTRGRVSKYLAFSRSKKFGRHDFLERELTDFLRMLYAERIDYVPLHWDFHLSNLNANRKGEVTGVFDFDNAMRGHSLADLGQVLYWLRFRFGDRGTFEHVLKGYKGAFTRKQTRMVRAYCLLHLLAVSRTIWNKRRLRWIIEEHERMREEFVNSKL